MWMASMPSTPTPRITSSDLIRIGPGAAALLSALASCAPVEAFVASDSSSTRFLTLPSQLAQCRGRLPEPEWHVHSTEQVRRGQEIVRGAVTVASAQVQPTDPQVATRQQGTHLQLFRQRDCRQEVALGLVDVEGTARGGCAEHVQRGSRIPALTALLGEGQGPLGDGRCFVDC